MSIIRVDSLALYVFGTEALSHKTLSLAATLCNFATFSFTMSPSRAMDVEEPLEDIEAGEQDPLHQAPSQPVYVSSKESSPNTTITDLPLRARVLV